MKGPQAKGGQTIEPRTEDPKTAPVGMTDTPPYAAYILRHLPRVLSQVNRDRDMTTYGSCDRNYWHQSIRDFSSAILQQTCLTLALVYKEDFPGNYCYGNENVREWSVAALRYMGTIQLKDGSFNEYYPNEHSFPATAFNLYAACKTYRLLKLEDAHILGSLRKAADWLCCHDETATCNQQLASIAGLYQYYRITEAQTVLDGVDRKMTGILSLYSGEGWFPEQGGADIGYSSVALDMLTDYFEESGDERVRRIIEEMVEFLSHFIHPDGTAGGEYGSRNTVYFLPAGLEACVRLDLNAGTAAAMIRKLYEEDGRGSFMDSVDDRYLTHYVLHSYLRALAGCKPRRCREGRLPYQIPHRTVFKKAGLMTICDGDCYAVTGLAKGGILKVYRNGKEICNDCGYRIPLAPGRIAATNWLNPELEVLIQENQALIRGRFTVVKSRTQTPLYHFLLRLAALVRGERLRDDIKRLTIFQKEKSEASFGRRIVFEQEKIRIEDEICNPTGKAVVRASNISFRLVASAKFFASSDLLWQGPEHYGTAEKVTLCRTIDLRSGKTQEERIEYA